MKLYYRRKQHRETNLSFVVLYWKILKFHEDQNRIAYISSSVPAYGSISSLWLCRLTATDQRLYTIACSRLHLNIHSTPWLGLVAVMTVQLYDCSVRIILRLCTCGTGSSVLNIFRFEKISQLTVAFFDARCSTPAKVLK